MFTRIIIALAALAFVAGPVLMYLAATGAAARRRAAEVVAAERAAEAERLAHARRTAELEDRRIAELEEHFRRRLANLPETPEPPPARTPLTVARVLGHEPRPRKPRRRPRSARTDARSAA